MSHYPVYSYSPRQQLPQRRPTKLLQPPKGLKHVPWQLFVLVLVVILGFSLNVHIQHVHAKELAAQTAAAVVHHEQMVTAMNLNIAGVIADDSQVQFGVSVIDQTVQEQQFGSYTANNLLQAMIVQSDDPSWETLNDYISHASLASYAHSLGITDYNADNNMLSAHDLSLLLYRLDTHKILNSSDTSLLLGWLKQANYRQYIVPAVPDGDTVYRKIGLINATINDSAIITNGKKQSC